MNKCPYCSKEIESLGVVVKATMTLDSKIGYSSVEDIEETVGYYCVECGAELDFEKASQLADEMVERLEK